MSDVPPPRVRFLVADRDRGIDANTPAPAKQPAGRTR